MMKKFDWVRDLIIFLLSVSAILMNAGRWVSGRENNEQQILTKVGSLEKTLERYIDENQRLHEGLDSRFVSKENLELRLKNIELKIDNLSAKVNR